MSIGTMKGNQYEQVSGGVSPDLLARITALETKVNALEGTRADSNNYGTVKLSNAADVTDSTGLAVPTSELNATIDGTIANKINHINEKILQQIPWKRVNYTLDGKGSAVDLLNNPTKLFGKVLTPYAIIFTDYVGDSPVGGGSNLVFGYCYNSDDYGAQIAIPYTSAYNIKIRKKQGNKWADWNEI